jgi:murein DD-endopeptidase MepM/ murein hydrolase activator NlpD
MAFGMSYSGGAWSPLRVRQASFFSRSVKALLWLLALSLAFGVEPSGATATKQKPLRKEAPKPDAQQVDGSPRQTAKLQDRSPLLRQPVLPPLEPSDNREHFVINARSGDTVGRILTRLKIPQAERSLWERSMRRDIGNRIFPAGKEIHLYFAKTAADRRPPPHGQLQAIEIDDNDSLSLTWEKGLRGILFQRREKPFDVELKTVSGTVEDSFFEDGRKAGLHPTLLSQLTDIFTWDIDLEKDMRQGDSFKILYEQRSRRGQENRATLRILAAELINFGHKLTAIYFEKDNGQGNYFNAEGRSLARAFLRFPLEFSAITSRFTESRFHPMLKANVPHTGVDFAAPRGTPVRAVGDGIITVAGWNGAYGKTIDLKHDATYLSRYAHLDRFAQGIKPGVAVTKGQIIGYVGATGRATGPHLHFELYKDQQYIDPLSVDFPADETIDPALQRLFDSQMRVYLVALSFASPQS